MSDKKERDWTKAKFFGEIVVTYGLLPSIPASEGRIKSMIKRIRKHQQELIQLADPTLCRLFLPILQHDLNCLQSGDVSTDELQHMSAISYNVRVLMRQAKAKD